MTTIPKTSLPQTSVYGIGVLTNTHLYVCNWKNHESIPANRQVREVELQTELGTALAFGNMCELAIKYDLADLWVCPGSKISADIGESPTRYVFPSDDCYDRRHQTEDHGIPRSVTIKRKQGMFAEKRLIYITLPEHDVRWATDSGDWALADIEEPYVLLGALCYLWESDIIVRSSPGYSGIDLMKRTTDPLKSAKPNLSLWPDEHLEGDTIWTRPLTDSEAAMGYIHFFDRNSQRLGATTGLEIGMGDPDHVTVPISQPNLKLAGIWQVQVKELPGQAGLFPSPLTCKDWNANELLSKRPLWTTNEVCSQMQREGFVFEYLQGFHWTEKLDPKSKKSKRMQTRLLEMWAKKLWDTRKRLKESRQAYPNEKAADVAYTMIKIIATRAVGWLDLSKDRERPYAERGQWNRPDIANGIIGLARARMHLKMQEIWSEYRTAPVGVRTDMLIYCSDEPDPRKAFPKLVVREQELGGFKVVGTLPMSQTIINQMGSDDTHLHKLNTLKAMLNGEKVKVR
jgi:hypothetical protein